VGLLAFIAYATISPIQARPTLLTSTTLNISPRLRFSAHFGLAYPRQAALVIEKIAGSIVGIAASRTILYFD
jgi:hypothetical protein